MRKLTLLALVLVAGTAHADPAALEASGNKHYELAEYAAAIADFKEAFRLTDRPELLFNIAQAYRLSGDCAQARTFYKTYLRRLPAADNADRVRARIDELEACAMAPPPTVAPPVVTATPVTAPVVPSPKPAHRRTWMTKAGIAGLGGGALGAGLGFVFAVRGASKQDELRTACATSCTSAEARSLDDAGHAANRNAVIGFVAGGVLAAAGVVLIVLDGRARTEETGPNVTLDTHGASATWSWSF
jgi:tetratricopeptide (TPR) repeat protein